MGRFGILGGDVLEMDELLNILAQYGIAGIGMYVVYRIAIMYINNNMKSIREHIDSNTEMILYQMNKDREAMSDNIVKLTGSIEKLDDSIRELRDAIIEMKTIIKERERGE